MNIKSSTTKAKETPLHMLLVKVPMDTRDAVDKLSKETGINKQKIWRLKRGETKSIQLADATLLSQWFNQFFPCGPADLMERIPAISRKHKAKA